MAEVKDKSGTMAVERLKGLLARKVDSYEIFFSTERGFSVEVREGSVDALKVRSSAGVGLRTVSGKRLGFGFTSVLAEDSFAGLVENALKGSREAGEDPFLVLPGPSAAPEVSEESLGLFDVSFETSSEEEKIALAIGIETSARDFDGRIKRVRKAAFSESIRSSRVVNSRGVDISSTATFFSGSLTAVAEEGGESEMGWEMGMGHKRTDVNAGEIGRKAAKNAIRMLGGRKITTLKCPAVIENTVAVELLETLASSFLADNVHKGKSMLAGKIGKKVASPVLNIYDDGVMPGGWATSVYDGEGVSREKTQLLREGVLCGYLYDTYWAAREGARSTGNAVRAGYKSLPSVGISNIYIEKGKETLESLLGALSRGLFITEVMGVHTINTISGDFSLGAAGLWVEGGRVRYPVRGIAIAGNLLNLFSKVEAAGRDLKFIASIGSPSLLVSEIEASGT